MRRVVTGHKNNKSVILEDAEIPAQETPGGEVTLLWQAVGIPTIPLNEGELKKQFTLQMPEPGEIRLGLSSLPPDEEVLSKARERGIDAVEFWRKYFGDEYGMHTTNTIDYEIILSGELWMEVDDGVEVHLKPGDCVIQNGTRHAWRNRGSVPCVMAVVMVGATRQTD